MYALDTNTVLDYFKGKGEVAKNLLAVPPGEVALPAIVAYEVWIGVLGSQNTKRRQAQYEQFLATVEVLPFDSVVGRRAAELRYALERPRRRHRPDGHLDCGYGALTQCNPGDAQPARVRQGAGVEGRRLARLSARRLQSTRCRRIRGGRSGVLAGMDEPVQRVERLG